MSEKLSKMHALLADQMILILENGRPVYEEGKIVDWHPPSAVEMQAIIKFLDNNNINADYVAGKSQDKGKALDSVIGAANADIAKGFHRQYQ
jgi:hypothetical protein